MTRVNVVPVQELYDKHLLAEHREITRVPNTILSGKAKLTGDYPKEYNLGGGHVRFFYPRLKWLKTRYDELHEECIARGFKVSYIWPDKLPPRLYNDWEVTPQAVVINRERLLQNKPKDGKITLRKK